jgi:hypothetical protein
MRRCRRVAGVLEMTATKSMQVGHASSVRANHGIELAALMSTIFANFDLADPARPPQERLERLPGTEPTVRRKLIPREGNDIASWSKRHGLGRRVDLPLTRHVSLPHCYDNLKSRASPSSSPAPQGGYHLKLNLDYSTIPGASVDRQYEYC